MRNPGLEPGSLAAHEPESCASTNSASSARTNSLSLRLTIIHYRGGIRQLPQNGFSKFYAARKYGQTMLPAVRQGPFAEADKENTAQKTQGYDNKFQNQRTGLNVSPTHGRGTPLD